MLVGLAAYPFLPVAPLPRVEFPTIAVIAPAIPGASPETMASTVAQPLERQFAQIPGVAQLTSVNVLGQSQITLQFDLDRNIDAAAGDVQAAINAASGQLPKNLPSNPTYRKVNPSDSPILILAVQSDEVPLIDGRRLRRYRAVAADVADRRRVPGAHRRRTKTCGAGAGRSRPSLPHGPDAGGCAQRAGQRHRRCAEGHRQHGHVRRSPFTTTISLPKRREYNDVILAWRNGAPVRVRDIGQRDRRARESAICGAWQNGKQGILLVVFKQPGANVIDTVERIKAALPHLEASIPPSVHVDVMMDRTLTIRASVDGRAVHPDPVHRAWW